VKKFRQVIFWSHLITGILAGIVVLIMSVTGVLLTYEKQTVAWADTRGFEVVEVPGASRLPIADLVASARSTRPEIPTGVSLKADPQAPAVVMFPKGKFVLVNPYTGAVLGEGATSTRAFFRTVTDLHRWLAASGDNLAVGRAITGACNLGFLFLVVSGLYIWWPKKWTAAQLRSVLWFRRGLSSKARDFNWHNVIGFWSLVPLFFVVLSGVVISYGWASNLVYVVAGEAPPAPRGAPPPAGPKTEPPDIAIDGIEELVARAAAHTQGWRTLSFQLPTDAAAPVSFSLDAGTGGQPQHRSSLTLDRVTGEVVTWEPFASLSAGRRWRAILRFAHTGEVLGIAGQTVAGIVSLGACFLVYTGFTLSWRRYRAWSARRKTSRTGARPVPMAEAARPSAPEALADSGE